MLASEPDDYQLENKEKLIIEDLYQNGVLIGHKKTIKQNGGYYREFIYDANNQIMSDMKYFGKNQLISGKIYQNGKIIQYIETDTDSYGNVHQVVMDNEHKIISHAKFDQLGRHISSLIYENNRVIGMKEFQYSGNGDIIEIVRNENYKIILERKLKTNRDNSDKNTSDTNSVIIEQHEIKTDENGKTHEIVYDANNNILSDKEISKQKHTKPSPVVTITPVDQETQQTVKPGKITAFLSKILRRQK
jgi:hypothetical protein